MLQLAAAANLAHRRGDLPPGGPRQDRGALRRGDRGRRRDRRGAGGAGRGRSSPTATRSASRFQIADDLLDYGGVSASARQEHRRRFPRAEDDAAGDPRRRRGRRGRAGVLGAGDRQGRAARRRPRGGARADGAARRARRARRRPRRTTPNEAGGPSSRSPPGRSRKSSPTSPASSSSGRSDFRPAWPRRRPEAAAETRPGRGEVRGRRRGDGTVLASPVAANPSWDSTGMSGSDER